MAAARCWWPCAVLALVLLALPTTTGHGPALRSPIRSRARPARPRRVAFALSSGLAAGRARRACIRMAGEPARANETLVPGLSLSVQRLVRRALSTFSGVLNKKDSGAVIELAELVKAAEVVEQAARTVLSAELPRTARPAALSTSAGARAPGVDAVTNITALTSNLTRVARDVATGSWAQLLTDSRAAAPPLLALARAANLSTAQAVLALEGALAGVSARAAGRDFLRALPAPLGGLLLEASGVPRTAVEAQLGSAVRASGAQEVRTIVSWSGAETHLRHSLAELHAACASPAAASRVGAAAAAAGGVAAPGTQPPPSAPRAAPPAATSAAPPPRPLSAAEEGSTLAWIEAALLLAQAPYNLKLRPPAEDAARRTSIQRGLAPAEARVIESLVQRALGSAPVNISTVESERACALVAVPTGGRGASGGSREREPSAAPAPDVATPLPSARPPVVVSFRGTKEAFPDLITDATFLPRSFKPPARVASAGAPAAAAGAGGGGDGAWPGRPPAMSVHGGFLAAFESVLPQLEQELARAPADAELVFVGHSMGGALATLAAAHFWARRPSLVTFGAPAVGSDAFVSHVRAHARPAGGLRVWNEGDVIVTIALAAGYRHAGVSVPSVTSTRAIGAVERTRRGAPVPGLALAAPHTLFQLGRQVFAFPIIWSAEPGASTAAQPSLSRAPATAGQAARTYDNA